ncbi:hypothetical protein TYRP_018214 [Tyrophagus putrescentiae]|nr:hypothetical protein TYRP_018214 [Tyrophagus putrescentiae]
MGNDSKSKLPSSTPGQPEMGDNSDLPNKDDDLVEGKEPIPQPPPLLSSSSSTTSTSAPSKPKKAEENQSLPGPSKSILARFKHRLDCPVAQTGLCSCFRELVSSAKATTTEETRPPPPPPKVVAGSKKKSSGKKTAQRGKRAVNKKRPPTPPLRYKQDSKTFASPYRFPSEVPAYNREQDRSLAAVEPSASVAGEDASSGNQRRRGEEEEREASKMHPINNALIESSASILGEDASSGLRRRSPETPSSALVVADPSYGKIREEASRAVSIPARNALVESSASVLGEDASSGQRRRSSENPSLTLVKEDPSYGQIGEAKENKDEAVKKANEEDAKKGWRF